jgi:hypothetical protein
MTSHFIGGAFLAEGFRLFKNGGTPLLERRDGPLVEELVLQARQGHRTEPTLLTARVHLSHEKLRDVRARYWTTPARAPTILAGGNVGQLELPPGWAVWDVSDGAPVLERLVDWLRTLVLPWFALFEDPVALCDTLHETDVPLLNRLNALEWMIAEFGRREAADYYRSLVSTGLMGRPTASTERLRSLEVCFRLNRR